MKLRDDGHKLLGGRKERRRMSLLGSRRFMGDYMGIGAKGFSGEFIGRSAGIPPTDPILFSCRVEILVSKLGRSSKPSPRILIMVNDSLPEATTRSGYADSHGVVDEQSNLYRHPNTD